MINTGSRTINGTRGAKFNLLKALRLYSTIEIRERKQIMMTRLMYSKGGLLSEYLRQNELYSFFSDKQTKLDSSLTT